MDVDLQGRNRELFLSDTMGLTQNLLEDILNRIRDLGSFSRNNPHNYKQQIIALSNDISLIVQVTTLLSKVVFARNKELLNQVKDSHMGLLFIMKAINQANQKEDLVALEELIKYELKDNLTQWKIDLIPQIKRFIPLN